MDDLAWKCLGGFCSEASTTLFEFKLRGVFARGLVSPIQSLSGSPFALPGGIKMLSSYSWFSHHSDVWE